MATNLLAAPSALAKLPGKRGLEILLRWVLEKVGRDEFIVLEKRVLMLEKKITEKNR